MEPNYPLDSPFPLENTVDRARHAIKKVQRRPVLHTTQPRGEFGRFLGPPIKPYATLVVLDEMKAEENLKAKSLASFCKTYDIRHAARTSLSGYREEPWFTNVPLYTISCLDDLSFDKEGNTDNEKGSCGLGHNRLFF